MIHLELDEWMFDIEKIKVANLTPRDKRLYSNLYILKDKYYKIELKKAKLTQSYGYPMSRYLQKDSMIRIKPPKIR